jgi:hypothetical protein
VFSVISLHLLLLLVQTPPHTPMSQSWLSISPPSACFGTIVLVTPVTFTSTMLINIFLAFRALSVWTRFLMCPTCIRSKQTKSPAGPNTTRTATVPFQGLSVDFSFAGTHSANASRAADFVGFNGETCWILISASGTVHFGYLVNYGVQSLFFQGRTHFFVGAPSFIGFSIYLYTSH